MEDGHVTGHIRGRFRRLLSAEQAKHCPRQPVRGSGNIGSPYWCLVMYGWKRCSCRIETTDGGAAMTFM